MKLSLTISPDAPAPAPVVWKGDLAQGVVTAAKLGYDAVELHVYSLEAERVREVKRLLKANKLAVSGVCHGMAYRGEPSSFSNEDPGLRRKALDRIKHQIELAHEFETQVLSGIVHGTVSPDPSLSTQQWEWIVEGVTASDAYARGLGVVFAIEGVNRYETNCLNTSQEIVTLISDYHLQSTRVHLDTFHMNIEERSIEEAIQRAGPLLSYVHFADSNRKYPGAGHLDYPSIVSALRQVKYEGYLGMELMAWPDPMTAAHEALQAGRRLLTA